MDAKAFKIAAEAAIRNYPADFTPNTSANLPTFIGRTADRDWLLAGYLGHNPNNAKGVCLIYRANTVPREYESFHSKRYEAGGRGWQANEDGLLIPTEIGRIVISKDGTTLNGAPLQSL